VSQPLFLQETFANPADARLIVEYINQGNIFRGECDMRTVAGVRTFDLTCHPGIDPVSGEKAIGLSATDVTEHKIVEQERDQLRENQVREAQADAISERQRTIRARKLFMATASHEQRTPLQTVVGCVDRLEQAPGDMHRCLVELKDAAEQLIRINEDLVEFVRADSAPGPRVKAVNAKRLVCRALLPSQKAAAAKKLTFSMQESDLERDIRIDEMRVRQVISNLASNAVKYTKIGSIAVVARLDGGPGALALRISIRDTGIGMDGAYAEKVMLPFVRGPESEVVDPQGLGLGLAIVQSHLAELNGELQIESSPRAGTTVSVSIPCDRF
jgi:signal transduction histidine kinase